jgi:prepilin-type N-terminal cleavage/methylation domain-containing protein
MHGSLRTSVGSRGFTLTELIIVVAIIGVLAAVTTPMYLAYLRTATVEGAAREVATLLNQGRSLAISRNQPVCVQINGARVRYALNGCASATFYLGPGTDGNGYIRLTDGVDLTANASPVFTALGAASTAATFTVTHSQYPGVTMPVTVSASGRVRVGS